MPTAPNQKSEQMVRTAMHSDNSDHYNILVDWSIFARQPGWQIRTDIYQFFIKA